MKTRQEWIQTILERVKETLTDGEGKLDYEITPEPDYPDRLRITTKKREIDFAYIGAIEEETNGAVSLNWITRDASSLVFVADISRNWITNQIRNEQNGKPFSWDRSRCSFCGKR